MDVMAELAYAFGWTPEVLGEMEIDELREWHEQAARILKEANKRPAL